MDTQFLKESLSVDGEVFSGQAIDGGYGDVATWAQDNNIAIWHIKVYILAVGY